MTELTYTENTISAQDRVGNIYEVGIPPQYLRPDAEEEDKAVLAHFQKMLSEIVSNPEKDHSLIIPVVRDENGQPYFYFNIHHKSKPKYKYRETHKIGETEHIFEADTLERLNELKLEIKIDQTNE